MIELSAFKIEHGFGNWQGEVQFCWARSGRSWNQKFLLVLFVIQIFSLYILIEALTMLKYNNF